MSFETRPQSVSDLAPLWLPVPKSAKLTGEYVKLPHVAAVNIHPAPSLQAAALRFVAQARRLAGVDWTVTATLSSPVAVDVHVSSDEHLPQDGYRLSISARGVEVRASDRAGALYALSTLTQLIRQYGVVLPAMAVEDAPDIAVRGVMVDVSRTKVPTMDTMFALIDRLSELKVNHLELYMEHTFAYRDHREVWAGASPFTGPEILALDAYCRERGVDLVPNQNTLGHLARWLKLKRYRPLAETPDGSEFPWGHIDGPFSLAPTNPDSLTFIKGLLDELLPHFTSESAHIGFDEAYDVGQGYSKAAVDSQGKGRVLISFLQKVSKLVRSHGRTPLFWADMVTRHHAEEIVNLPEGAVACEWGYEGNYAWDLYLAPLAKARRPFYVCPGTSSWLSFTGRNEQGEANLRTSARAARTYGANGYLITDWGDRGHMQPLPVSYRGFALGASLAWNESLPDQFDDAVGLHLFEDRTGRAGHVVQSLGLIHAHTTRERPNGEEDSFLALALLLPHRLAELRTHVTPELLDRIRLESSQGADAVSTLSLGGQDAGLVREELRHASAALQLAADVLEDRLSPGVQLSQLLAWQDEFRRLWAQRFRPGGLEESLHNLDPLRDLLVERQSAVNA